MKAGATFPTAHQLSLVAAVVELGGVSAAAASLRISQPAITSQLKQAESSIGRRLFVRTHRGLLPTAAGREVAAFARRQEAARGTLVRSLGSLADPCAGSLAIGVSSTAGETWLPQRLAELRRRFPAADVRVVMGNSTETIERLQSRAVDVAASGLAIRGRGVTCVEAGWDRIVAVAARASRFTRGTARASSLADATFILREEGSATRKHALSGLRRIGVIPRRTIPVATNEAVIQMAAAGLGVGFVSAHATQRFVDDGDVAIVRIGGWSCRRHVYVARRADARTPIGDVFWKVATAPR